jgi:hypothetical protein
MWDNKFLHMVSDARVKIVEFTFWDVNHFRILIHVADFERFCVFLYFYQSKNTNFTRNML